MTDAEAERRSARPLGRTEGEPVCPHCGGLDAYDCRRSKGAPRFRCRACTRISRITSGTLFASPQAAAALLSRRYRDLLQRSEGQERAGALPRPGRVLQGAFVLLHKLREAMAEEMKGRMVGGEGKVAEVDGGYFGGYVQACQPQREPPVIAASPKIRPASARPL